MRILRSLLGLGAALALACSRPEEPVPLQPSAQRATEGAVVVSLSPAGAAARAGLQPGDVLLTWRRPGAPGSPRAAAGPLRSCADLSAAEVAQAPLGPVELRVVRGTVARTVVLPPGEWLLETVDRSHDPDGFCQADARARRLSRELRWGEAAEAWTEALKKAAGATADPLYPARAQRERALCLTAQDRFAEAQAALEDSLRRLRSAAPGSLEEAATWHALGRLEQRRGAFGPSEKALRRALALRSRLAPRSLERASTLNNLGIDAWSQGDLPRARALYLSALALIRQRAPGSRDEARVLNNLGLLARATGDGQAAESTLLASSRLWEKIDPQSPDLARTYASLGALAADRGDLSLSDAYGRTALKRLEAHAPDSLEVATLYRNLGMNSRDRGDLSEAETLVRRALAIIKARAPGTVQEATCLSTLSLILKDRKRLGEAEAMARQGLALRSRITPASPDVALSLSSLGAIAAERGYYETARSLGEQALALQRKSAPETLQECHLHLMLASVALEQERWPTAESRARAGLAIVQKVSPESWLVARALNLLAVALWKTGRLAEARTDLARAAELLEKQTGRVGGTDVSRSGFQSMHSAVYQNLAGLDVEMGHPATAVATLERWRAHVLLAQLAEHSLAHGPGVPPALLGRLRRLDREYERLQEAVARPGLAREEAQELAVRLTRLRSERSEAIEAMVRASPRYASLRQARSLDLAAARQALDPGTVWLSYLVTRDESYLFVVTAAADERVGDGLRVFHLPIGRDELAAEVSVFRGLILRGRGRAAAEAALLTQGRRLFDRLLTPALPWIERSRRLLISPDASLHTLPFAALVRPGEPARFLVEWKPLHTVLSATLYAGLRKSRDLSPGPTDGGRLVAFADPRLPGATAPAEADDPPLRRYRSGLAPLPGAREEVEALASLYGKDARIYTGANASEARFWNLGARPRILHFATHALLDARSPLDSGLALGPSSNGGDGLLQAWEIIDRLRLDADLVTLSACGTGLGRETAGEGLLGLTRAFQFAGARSVLASLWTVPDRSTAVLMDRFYSGLRSGRPKDVALAEAQRQLLRTPGLAHPYAWAGFELKGDWR